MGTSNRKRSARLAPERAALSNSELAALEEYAYQRGYADWKDDLRKDWAGGMTDYAKVYPHAAAVLLHLRDAAYFGAPGLEKHTVAKLPTDPRRNAERFRWRFAAFLAAPDLVRWERLAHLIVPGTGRTMWQAWVAVDGNAEAGGFVEGRGFSHYPDPFTARRARKAAEEGRVPVGLQALQTAHAAAPALPNTGR